MWVKTCAFLSHVPFDSHDSVEPKDLRYILTFPYDLEGCMRRTRDFLLCELFSIVLSLILELVISVLNRLYLSAIGTFTSSE